MSEIFIQRGTPKQVYRWVKKCVYSGIVPFVQSSPGMGKSSLMRKLAKEENLFLIDHRLSTSAVEDLSGLPRFTADGYAEFAQFRDLFPLEDQPIPKGYVGWLLLLDEFNSASRSVQAASYKLILDRMVGQKKLHQNVAIVAAGNLSTDKAIVNNLGTAMQSRVANLEMTISFEDWLYDVALPENYDKRIVAFLSQYPTKLMNFDPNHNDKTFACPRTWSFMNALLQNEPGELEDQDAGLFAGVISTGIAVEFIQYSKVFSELVTINQIIANPTTCTVPTNTALKWATVTSVSSHVDDKNFTAISDYINRFDMSFKILFYRSIIIQQPTLRNHPAYANAASQLARYLAG